MKKLYNKPEVKIEFFTMNENIAAGCGNVVNLGPGDGSHDRCSDYPDMPDEISLFAWNPGDHMDALNANFYPGSCECYMNAGDTTLFTS